MPDGGVSEPVDGSLGNTGFGRELLIGSNSSEVLASPALESVVRLGSFCVPCDAPCAAPAVLLEDDRVVDARYCPIGWSTRPQPESTTPSGQIATIARSSTTRMGCLGRSPQSPFRQAGQRVASARRSFVWLAAVSVFWWLGTGRLQAEEAPNPTEAQEANVQDSTTPGVSGLDGQLTLDSGATCLERKRLISRIIRWRETEDIDATLKVQVWGDPKVATRVFFSVARDGVDPAERTLANVPSECDELHSAVALSIALAIDSLFAGRGKTPLMAAIDEAEEKQKANKDTGPQYRPFWEAGLLVGATLSIVPSVAIAALPRVHYAILPWLAIAAEGVVTRAERLPFLAGPVTYDAMVVGGGLDACFGGETAERMSFYVCVGGRGGGFLTQGYGAGGNTSTIVTRPWWALAGSAQARAWILPSFGIGIGIEGMFALLDRELSLMTENQMKMTQPLQPFGLAVSGGPVFRFF